MIVVILGTRPDLIKCAPLIKRLAGCKVLHTGQHYSEELDGQIIKDMDVRIDHRLDVPEGAGVERAYNSVYNGTLAYLESVHAGLDEDYLGKRGVVVVYGDTLSALASAAAAKTEGWLVAHVEAGLRSFDLTMPEEVARVAIDAMSDRLYAPTSLQKGFLLAEGQRDEKIKVFGNVVVDSLKYIRGKATDKLVTGGKKYAVMTLHRQENMRPDALEAILDAVQLVSVSEGVEKVLFPCHPGARGMVEANLGGTDDRGIIELVQPVAYKEMIELLEGCFCVFSDSGGLQEETALLGKKCVTFRKSTERQETIEAGHNVLISPLTHNFMGVVLGAIEHLRRPASAPTTMYGANPADLIAADLSKWRGW